MANEKQAWAQAEAATEAGAAFLVAGTMEIARLREAIASALSDLERGKDVAARDTLGAALEGAGR